MALGEKGLGVEDYKTKRMEGFTYGLFAWNRYWDFWGKNCAV
jgi:hypothetical protein